MHQSPGCSTPPAAHQLRPARYRASALGDLERAERGLVAEPAVEHGPLAPPDPDWWHRCCTAGWSTPPGRGLAATGHATDTIMIGETASARDHPARCRSSGRCTASTATTRPLTWLGSRRARRARRSAAEAQFVAGTPGLFDISGYAHHPYSFDSAAEPPVLHPGHDHARRTSASFERDAQRVVQPPMARAGRGGVPIYLTEYGYKTNPPNPFVHTSLQQQATWLNQGEYMSWQDPLRARARAVPARRRRRLTPRARSGSREYWSTFQSGPDQCSTAPEAGL